MSVRINWQEITPETQVEIKRQLNEYLAQATLPDVLGPVRVSCLEFGDNPPAIRILSIDEPDEILLKKFDKYVKGQELKPADVEMVVSMSYNGGITLTVETDVRVNVPVPAFVSLPIVVKTTNIHVQGKLKVTTYEGQVGLSFETETGSHEGPLKDIQFFIELGDREKKVWKDDKEITSIVKDCISSFISDKMMYPNVLLLKAPDNAEDVTDEGAQTQEQV
eukprot:GFYU01008218.1.p1 GENE.GFYU01008218.1~~GFYU01008218.1.p1  ORF type:complete len:244 (-),score=62.23 GFYU01008218.1:199-861(-)